MMKEKRLYQSPWTRRDLVELEDGFCGSITNDAGLGQTIESTTQGYETFDAQKTDAFAKDDDGNIEWK